MKSMRSVLTYFMFLFCLMGFISAGQIASGPPMTMEKIKEILNSDMTAVYKNTVKPLYEVIQKGGASEEIYKMYFKARLFSAYGGRTGNLDRDYLMFKERLEKHPEDKEYILYSAMFYWVAPREVVGGKLSRHLEAMEKKKKEGGKKILTPNDRKNMPKISGSKIYEYLGVSKTEECRYEAEKRFWAVSEKYPDYEQLYKVMYVFYNDEGMGAWHDKKDRERVFNGLKKMLDLWVACEKKPGESFYRRSHFRLHGQHDYKGAISDAQKIAGIERWKEPAEMIMRKAKMASNPPSTRVPLVDQQKNFEFYLKKISKKDGVKWEKEMLENRLKAFENGSVNDSLNARCCLKIAEIIDDKNEGLKWCNIGLKFAPQMDSLYDRRSNARCYWDKGVLKGDIQGSIKDLEIALSINPNNKLIKKGIEKLKKRLAEQNGKGSSK